MKKDPGKVLIGVDIVQLQDHVDTLKNLDKCNILKWESAQAITFIPDILDNVAMCEDDLGGKCYRKNNALEELLKKSRGYIKQVNVSAEVRHDSEGAYYMDGAQFEIMQETESLLNEIDGFLSEGVE